MARRLSCLEPTPRTEALASPRLRHRMQPPAVEPLAAAALDLSNISDEACKNMKDKYLPSQILCICDFWAYLMLYFK